MSRIYSKLDPTELILSELKASDIQNYRTDLSPDEEFLQVSGRKLKLGTIVPAHKHLQVDRTTNITQEAWVVLKGKVKGIFYDLDNTIIYETILTDGDCIVLYRGGHSLEVLEEDTIFYEFKTGPYFGVEVDKEKI
jgi:cupin fold WbuC family metalloprotein